MRNTIVILIFALCCTIPTHTYCWAESIDEEPWYENNDQVPYPNNTGPLGTGDNSADITSNTDSGLVGALKGEITLHNRDDIVEVFSNGNLVEQLIKGVGSTGIVKDFSASSITFEPMGRPSLRCPAQTHVGWFGPCTIQTNET